MSRQAYLLMLLLLVQAVVALRKSKNLLRHIADEAAHLRSRRQQQASGVAASTPPTFCDPTKHPLLDQHFVGGKFLQCYPYWHRAQVAATSSLPCSAHPARVFIVFKGLADTLGQLVNEAVMKGLASRAPLFIHHWSKVQWCRDALACPFDWTWAQHCAAKGNGSNIFDESFGNDPDRKKMDALEKSSNWTVCTIGEGGVPHHNNPKSKCYLSVQQVEIGQKLRDSVSYTENHIWSNILPDDSFSCT